MLTSLDQLFKHYSISENNAQKMRIVCKPRASTYTSLVHNFENTKLLKVHLHDYETGHRLVPFGGDTYGVYVMDGYSSFNKNTGSLNVEYGGDSHTLGTPRIIIKFNKDGYNVALEEYNKFWEWRNNRNPTRLAMEEEFSFDGKHAMHCIRLLRMGAEALETGQVNVYRPDAEELLSIRNGSWSYEKIVEYAEQMDKHVRETLYLTTKLPKRPNVELAANLILQIQDMTWTA